MRRLGEKMSMIRLGSAKFLALLHAKDYLHARTNAARLWPVI